MGKFSIKINNQKSQSLVELVIGIGLGVVFLGIAVGSIVLILRNNLEARTSQIAASLAQEYLDGVSAIGESNWLAVYNPPAAKGADSQFHLDILSYAYVADDVFGLQLINISISNLASSSLASTYPTGYARGVYVSGNYAYVADDNSGLQIINISNPADPTPVVTYDTDDVAYGVYVSGNYAYVADGYAGLQIIDISNPANPNPERITHDTNGAALDVYVSGNYAYVADANYGLQIIDISNPANPNPDRYTYSTGGAAQGVYVSGNYAYVADNIYGLQVINISNPANPNPERITYSTDGSAFGVYVSGNYAYVAESYIGLQVINISTPLNPTPVVTYDTDDAAYRVYVSGNYAYVADGYAGLQIIDISNPANPNPNRTTFNTDGVALAVYVPDTNNYSIISGIASTTVEGRSFTRYFSIENVNREDCGTANVTESGALGNCAVNFPGSSTDINEDPSTQKITATVEWDNGRRKISLVKYLTRSQNIGFKQSDWSGGPNQTTFPNNGTIVNDKFSTSTNNIDSTSTQGSVSLIGDSIGTKWFRTGSVWSRRAEHASVVFDNKMWVMGGEDDSGNLLNDVWYSTDAITWTQATSSANWSGRYRHTSVVFDNKIWVMGGYGGGAKKNDVWYSTDGINWTEATSSANWSPRSNHTSVVFDNKIWVMGGYDDFGSEKNDIWFSDNGINWTEATSSANWSPRYDHTSVVFNDGSGDKMWVMGGRDINPQFKNDVWSSTDGINWTEATSSAGWEIRKNHASVVFNNGSGDKMWVMGGEDVLWDPLGDVWYSTDGINWTQATSSANWSPRRDHTSVVFNNGSGDKMWVIGGEAAAGPLYKVNNVWSSSNGINWTEETSSANWLARNEHTSVVFNNRMWVIGGNGGNGLFNDNWSSNNGIVWTEATSSANWSPRRGHASVVFNNGSGDKIWVMGGINSSYYHLSNVWYSTDGINWTQATSSANWSPRRDHTSVVFNNGSGDKMWVMGGENGSYVRLNDVWFSIDGINWTEATSSANWSARNNHASVVFDNKMWVMGGYDNSSNYKNDVWYSTDGTTWIQATSSANWSPRTNHTSVVFDNKMWVIGGYDSSSNYKNDVWFSDNGINWTEATSSANWLPRSNHTSVVFGNKIWVMGGKDNSTHKDDTWYFPLKSIAGNIISSIFYAQSSSTINTIMWLGQQLSGTIVKFQIASSNSINGPWNFFGPDGSSSNWYSAVLNSPVKINPIYHNNYAYFRYKMFLEPDIDGSQIPRVDDVIINWSP